MIRNSTSASSAHTCTLRGAQARAGFDAWRRRLLRGEVCDRKCGHGVAHGARLRLGHALPVAFPAGVVLPLPEAAPFVRACLRRCARKNARGQRAQPSEHSPSPLPVNLNTNGSGRDAPACACESGHEPRPFVPAVTQARDSTSAREWSLPAESETTREAAVGRRVGSSTGSSR